MAERFRRKAPARTTPIRHLSGLYKSPRRAPNGTDTPRGAEADAASTSDATQAVNAGYRVVEKHLADGRRAAEHLAGLLKPAQSRASADLGGIVERLIRQSAELIPLWFQMLDAIARTEFQDGVAQSSAPANAAMDTRHAGARTAHSVNAIQIESRVPVEIVLDLHQPLDGVPLRTFGLHALEENKPPITDVVFVGADNGARPTLRIRIPDGQPPGLYSGVVVDRVGEPAGTISLRVRG